MPVITTVQNTNIYSVSIMYGKEKNTIVTFKKLEPTNVLSIFCLKLLKLLIVVDYVN